MKSDVAVLRRRQSRRCRRRCRRRRRRRQRRSRSEASQLEFFSVFDSPTPFLRMDMASKT